MDDKLVFLRNEKKLLNMIEIIKLAIKKMVILFRKKKKILIIGNNLKI
jgi:hypothetical protein